MIIMMASEGHWPPSAGGPFNVYRSSIGSSFFPAQSISSSPPAFGDGKFGFVLDAKSRFRSGMPLIINEGGLLNSNKTIEDIGKGKNVLVEDKGKGHFKIALFPDSRGELHFNAGASSSSGTMDILNKDENLGLRTSEGLASKIVDLGGIISKVDQDVGHGMMESDSEGLGKVNGSIKTFGKFHLTMLGIRWVLCSFYEPESLESVYSNGPWLPNLPLQCWDELNICRITSMVGKPYLLDGNMFQWGRREFARICVHIKLEDKLTQGVWVEGSSGKFFQRIEYERIFNFYYNYVDDKKMAIAVGAIKGGYGPWIHVNYGKRRNKKPIFKKIDPRPVKEAMRNGTGFVNPGSMEKNFEAVKVYNDGDVPRLDLGGAVVSPPQNVLIQKCTLQLVDPDTVVGMDSSPCILPTDDNKFKILNDIIEEGEIILSRDDDVVSLEAVADNIGNGVSPPKEKIEVMNADLGYDEAAPHLLRRRVLNN
ncbi:hypothetical protein M5K25_024608 [Dendrobium thyrsiflorum]|uniref:DUF4283 domain-containing protein n=1 Tax=Dendrobium thyrsiflorum TaxID=117978 RepID=A0ABD0U2U4_DENTH